MYTYIVLAIKLMATEVSLGLKFNECRYGYQGHINSITFIRNNTKECDDMQDVCLKCSNWISPLVSAYVLISHR